MEEHDEIGNTDVSGPTEILDTDIGKVRLGRSLSRSEAVEVFEGWTLVERRKIAVKCFSEPAIGANEEWALERLSGAPAPHLLGHARIGVRNALLLEWIEGVALSDWHVRRAGERNPDALRSVLLDVADAIGELHRNGVVHCDLKPAHIVVLPDQSIRIIDFSASVSLERPSESPIHLTPETAAPERLRGGQVGRWTDIHGFGVVLFWLLTGRLPRPGDAEATEDAAGAAAMALARRCLAARPEDRPANSEELRVELIETSFPTDLPAAGEAFPDTIQMRRRLPGSLPATPTTEPNRPRGTTTLRVARVVLILAILGALAAPAGWYGLVFYERHYKKNWIVDAAGNGDAVSVAEVLERGGENLTIQLAGGRHLLPTITERHISILAFPGLETAPVVFSSGAVCAELVNATVRLTGLTLDASNVPENAGCLDITGGMVTLSEILIENAGGTGLDARRGARLEIYGLLVDGAKEDGLRLSGGVEALVERITVRNVAGIGVSAIGGARFEARDFSVSMTGGAGIAVGSGAIVTVAGGLVEKAAGSAVDAMDGAVLRLTDVRIEKAKGAGIAVYDGAHLSLSQSEIAESALSGLLVDSAGSVSLVDVGIARNGEHGAVLLSLRKGSFQSVTIEANRGAGIAIFPEVNLELTEANVTGNGGGDILDGRPAEPAPPSEEEAGSDE